MHLTNFDVAYTHLDSINHHGKIQTPIIGGGVIGLSIARALSKIPKFHEILLLELLYQITYHIKNAVR